MLIVAADVAIINADIYIEQIPSDAIIRRIIRGECKRAALLSTFRDTVVHN